MTQDIQGHIEGHMESTDRTVQALTKVLNDTQTKRMFEIGFNAGHSSHLWLELSSELYLTSVDICEHTYTKDNAAKIKSKYEERFDFIEANSQLMDTRLMSGFDTYFIDGDHHEAGFKTDLQNCVRAGAEYIIIDDYTKTFEHIMDITDRFLAEKILPYEKLYTFDYDATDGNNTGVLLKLL